jgi:hypothetical protein
VPSAYIEEFGASGVLAKAGLTSFLSKFYSSPSEDDYKKILKMLEDPGVVGDMFVDNFEMIVESCDDG